MLAIIIPYYKLTFFEATLKSLANQTDKRFKVYIGDDASPEHCVMLLNKFKGLFDFEYHRFETNFGGFSLTQQWERCIKLSENEKWLMILGDDDILEYNVVEEFYSNLENIIANDCQVIRFASRYIDENQIPLKGFSDYLNPVLESAENSFYRNFLGQSRSSLSEYVFSRNSFLKFKFKNYPLAWHSDDKAWLDFSNNNPIFSINKAFVEVRVSSESITGKNDNELLKLEAKIEFYESVLRNKYYNFSKIQKENLLLVYGLLIQNNNRLSFFKIAFVFLRLVKLGAFFNAFRFLRRIIKSKF